MKVAVLKETFPGERRVGLIPANVSRLLKAGLEVQVAMARPQRRRQVEIGGRLGVATEAVERRALEEQRLRIERIGLVRRRDRGRGTLAEWFSVA